MAAVVKTRIVQGAAVATVLGGVFVGGTTLMDKTLTRHKDVPVGSELTVELTISTRSGVEAGNHEIAEALVVACLLEVRAGSESDRIVSLGGNRYRFVMRPGLDEADRRQLTGCIQDLRIDNVLANVVSMEQH